MERLKIIQYEDDYRGYLEEDNVSPDSIESYVSYLNGVSKYLSIIVGPQNITTEADVDALSKKLSFVDGVSTKTVSNYTSALRQYIKMVSSLNLNKWNVRDWEEVVLIVEPAGKAPKKYGEDVYRFSANLTLSIMMPRRGWELIKNTKNYIYLKPPPNLAGPPFELSVKIPSKKQAIHIAKKCYEEGESWMEQVGEWPAWYTHERQTQMIKIVPARGGSEEIRELLPPSKPESSLRMGEYGVWEIDLKNSKGEFDYHEYGRKKGGEIKESQENDLYEGIQTDVTQTKYERNPEARRKCIEHFGAKCSVCLFNFAEVYGDIGDDFIHVHHINPISSTDKEYKVNPIEDLIPLCPNCHAMVHKKIPPYTVEQLRKMYQRPK